MSLVSLFLVLLYLQLAVIHGTKAECAVGDAKSNTKWINSEGLKYPDYDYDDDDDEDENLDEKSGNKEEPLLSDLCSKILDGENADNSCSCTFLNRTGGIYSCYGSYMNPEQNDTWDDLRRNLKLNEWSNSNHVNVIKSYHFSGVNTKEIAIEYMETLHIEEKAFEGVRNVKTLRITHNNFGKLGQMELIFAGLVNLTTLDISFNNIIGWKSGGISTRENPVLPSLRKLNLSGNPLINLHNKTFEWLSGSKLQHLILQQCDIKSVETGALSPVQPTLQTIDLSGSYISNDLAVKLLTRNRLDYSCAVEGMALSKLGLTVVPYQILLEYNNSLRYLSLHSNIFRTLGIEQLGRTNTTYSVTSIVFPLMPFLEELDLRGCSIYYIQEDQFSMMPSLNSLLLSYNQLVSFKTLNVPHFSSLRYIDLSHNPLDLQNMNFSNFPSLEILDLSYTRARRISKNVFEVESTNLKKLSLCYTKMVRIDEKTFSNFEQLEVLDLEGNPNLGQTFSINTFYGLKALKELHLSGCGLKILPIMLNGENEVVEVDPLKHLTSLEKLNLANNDIRNISNKLLANVIQLESLDISGNFIRSWNEPIFPNKTNLKHLNAGHNHFNYITNAMLKDFKKLETLIIAENPFVCDCNCKEFLLMVRNITGTDPGDEILTVPPPEPRIKNLQQISIRAKKNNDSKIVATRSGYKALSDSVNEVNTFIETWNINEDYMCLDKLDSEEVDYVPFSKASCNRPTKENDPESEVLNNESTDDDTETMIITIVAVVLVIVTFGGIMYWKWWYIRYFAVLVKNATVLSFMANEDSASVDRIFNYDIFVSYSDHNREWVLDQLLPHLESKSNFKVCLHERDFQVGIGILENIIASMDRSRCILLVISNPFLRSQWCQFELHLAQHRLLETRREELILLFLEEIPKIKRPKTLHYLMKTKTYIIWPKKEDDVEGQKIFWKRLNYAVLRNSVESEKKYISIV